MRRAIGSWRSSIGLLHVPLFAAKLAETEVCEAEAALATIEEAIAEAERVSQQWFDAELHRIRGNIVLKQTPADPAAAEAAYLAGHRRRAIQKARSFELRAALALAKLYQSTGRPVEAHDVLGPALDGFSPTSEFPEIAEAFGVLASPRPSVQESHQSGRHAIE